MLTAGIGVFLIACNTLSANMESLSSNKLRALFSKASKSKLLGVGIGTVSTATIQSSGATTVLVIGFVNAGIVSLPLAASMIYGANIGTTITAQIAALSQFGDSTLSATAIFSALAGVGAFMMTFSKRDVYRKVGGSIAGLGMLFVGLSIMSDSMSGFAEMPAVRDFLSNIENIFLLLLIGVLLTAIVQSSSVVTVVAITMVGTGLITLNQGIYMTMGSNIGSCVVAIIASLTGGLNAKRTALIHLLFNVFGVLIFVMAGFVMGAFGMSYGSIFEDLFPGIPETQLAMFHTAFNVITVIIMLPLTSLLVGLVVRIMPERHVDIPVSDSSPRLYYLNDYMLKTPAIVVELVKKEVVNMSRIAMDNFDSSVDMICTRDFAGLDAFRANEERLDYLNKEVARYLVKLSHMPLKASDLQYISTAYRTVTDLERIGDYAENIVEYALKMDDSNERFSSVAMGEITKMRELVMSLYDKVLTAYTEADNLSLEQAYDIEDEIDTFTENMSENHIRRLNEGICTLDVGVKYLALASDAERIADHLINFGKSIRERKGVKM